MVDDRFDLFATPLRVVELADMELVNRRLLACLLDEERAAPGVRRSNVGGWHSAPDLAQRHEPALDRLFQDIVSRASAHLHELAPPAARPALAGLRYGLQAWGLVLRDGDYAVLHDHGDAHWSAVYYVDVGDEVGAHPESGGLAFVDPRRAGRPLPGTLLSALAPSTFLVRPRPSTLVLFPGWLQHYVHPYRGMRPRVSISCNLLLEALPAPG